MYITVAFLSWLPDVNSRIIKAGHTVVWINSTALQVSADGTERKCDPHTLSQLLLLLLVPFCQTRVCCYSGVCSQAAMLRNG